jgi:hypothetical protein
MQAFNHFQEDFEQMILQKEFHQLSASELKILDAEGMGEEEYNQIRTMLLSLNDLEEETEEPSAALKQKLLDVFDEGKEKKGIIIRWPIIVGISLAAAAMIALGIFLFNPDANHFEVKNEVSQELKSIRKEDSELPLVTDTQQSELSIVEAEKPNVDVSVSEEISVPDNQDNQDNHIFEPIHKIELAEAPVAAKDAEAEQNEKIKAPVITDGNATLANSSIPMTVTSAHVGNSYTWDNSVTNNLSGVAVSEKSKKKNDNQKSMSLAEFPQLISNTVTIY